MSSAIEQLENTNLKPYGIAGLIYDALSKQYESSELQRGAYPIRRKDGSEVDIGTRFEDFYDAIKTHEQHIVEYVDAMNVLPPYPPKGQLPSLHEFNQITGVRNSANYDSVGIIFDDGSALSVSGIGGIKLTSPTSENLQTTHAFILDDA